MVFSGTVYFNYAAVSFFGGENHQLRMQINPIYPLYSLYRYAGRTDDRPPPARAPLAATKSPDHAARTRPTLFVFVMGETARADRFSLNGYSRDTNRYTSTHEIINFSDVSSCGTSTADSVPCVFSRFGRNDFTHAKFSQEESLVLTLQRLGVETYWLDNSTGCKHACDPDRFIQLATADDPEHCDATGCFDEILLEHMNDLLDDTSSDHFIVLHQRGSHGPAYFTDAPQWVKAFLPECDRENLRNCSLEEVNNAYDNTILYSDYFLGRLIERLEEQSDRFDTAMLYVSDHGESLGEKGLYLHGLPYSFAPAEQTQVPMIFWGSDRFYANNSLDRQCIGLTASERTSHDAMFHTLMPLFGIDASDYDESLDLFSSCRGVVPQAGFRFDSTQ
jgi:lipid A ethanolaminephosphotransferase